MLVPVMSNFRAVIKFKLLCPEDFLGNYAKQSKSCKLPNFFFICKSYEWLYGLHRYTLFVCLFVLICFWWVFLFIWSFYLVYELIQDGTKIMTWAVIQNECTASDQSDLSIQLSSDMIDSDLFIPGSRSHNKAFKYGCSIISVRNVD